MLVVLLAWGITQVDVWNPYQITLIVWDFALNAWDFFLYSFQKAGRALEELSERRRMRPSGSELADIENERDHDLQ